MAFEETQTQSYSPTEYGYSFSNPDSTIDKTNLSFSMWKTTLQVRISPLVETGNNEYRTDRKNTITAFLIPTKAVIFADILKKFKEDPDKYNNYGVASGKSLLSVINPKSLGKDEDGCIINIRTITSEGTVENSYSYETKHTFNSVMGFNDKDGSFKQDFKTYANIEIDMIIKQLEEYAKAMTNTVAFSVTNSQFKYFDRIATKLGVDLVGNNNYTTRNRSYFDNSNQNQGTLGMNESGQRTFNQPPTAGDLGALIG